MQLVVEKFKFFDLFCFRIRPPSAESHPRQFDIELNKWHHFAMTFDHSALKSHIYLNTKVIIFLNSWKCQAMENKQAFINSYLISSAIRKTLYAIFYIRTMQQKKSNISIYKPILYNMPVDYHFLSFNRTGSFRTLSNI